MKQHVLLFVAVTAAAGCGKSSDLAAMAAEAKGIAEIYVERVAELDLRKQELVRRRDALKLEADSPGMKQLDDLVQNLPRLQAAVREAPGKIESIRKDEKIDEQKKIEELRSLSHWLEDKIANDWVEANAMLDTVDAWVFRAESRPRVQQASAAPPAPAGGAPPP
jgi:hypothetical protein